LFYLIARVDTTRYPQTAVWISPCGVGPGLSLLPSDAEFHASINKSE